VLCLFSSKGGVGCSVAAAAIGRLSAAREPTLLVDLRGDLDLVLGTAPSPQGLSDWFGVDQPSPDLLQRLEVRVGDGLNLLPRGPCRSPARPDRYRLLAKLLRFDPRRIIVDVGTHGIPAVALLAEAETSILVTRACFLALDTARRGPSPDQIILVEEEGRAMQARDVAAAMGAPVEVSVRWHRDVARAVDSGLLAGPLPRRLRGLETVL